MPVSRKEAQTRTASKTLFPLSRLRGRTKLHKQRTRISALFWPAFLPLIIISSLLVNWVFSAQLVFAAPTAPTAQSGHLTVQQFQSQGQPSKANQGAFQRPSSAAMPSPVDANDTQNKPLPSAEPATMQDLRYTLDDSFVLHRPTMRQSSAAATVVGTAIPTGTTPFALKGQDGRLEVDLPRSSLDFAQAALADGSAPVGQLILQLHQLAGHTIEAESILGTYQLQVVDSQGAVVRGVHLTQPLTFVYHYQTWELHDLNLDPNQIHLSWPGLLASAEAAKQSTSGMVVPLTNDATAQTLSAQSTLLGGMVALSGTPTIATPATPDLFETSGNSGQYGYSYPLAVVPGPDNFAPQLALAYSSQGTNERHNPVAPAGDEGDGWSLSLGSITSAQYPASSTGGAATWYSINDVDGVSDKLVPNPVGQTTWYITQHVSGLLVEWTGQHWKVWGKDGTYYEFGKTTDSQQKTSAGIYAWDLDKILAPYNSASQVKTMFVSYLQDSPDGGTTIRDAGIKQIQYGFATSASATSLSLVAGTVDFQYHAPTTQGTWATAYGTNYQCSNPPSNTTMRCDDPILFNSVPPPSVMSTLTLDTVTSYVGSDSANPVYQYHLTYEDAPYTTSHYDPYTLVQSAAGQHLLTKIAETVYGTGTAHALAPVEFGYSGALHDNYRDPSQPALGGSQDFGGQTFWHYLNWYEDLRTGEGAEISYGTAYGNMDGTPYLTDGNGNASDDRFDPLYCTYYTTCTGVYGHPEDYSWSEQVVTQIAALGTDSSGNPTTATTQYYYDMAAIPADRTPVSSCNPITGAGGGLCGR